MGWGCGQGQGPCPRVVWGDGLSLCSASSGGQVLRGQDERCLWLPSAHCTLMVWWCCGVKLQAWARSGL